jgi:hypothetical protein
MSHRPDRGCIFMARFWHAEDRTLGPLEQGAAVGVTSSWSHVLVNATRILRGWRWNGLTDAVMCSSAWALLRPNPPFLSGKEVDPVVDASHPDRRGAPSVDGG